MKRCQRAELPSCKVCRECRGRPSPLRSANPGFCGSRSASRKTVFLNSPLPLPSKIRRGIGLSGVLDVSVHLAISAAKMFELRRLNVSDLKAMAVDSVATRRSCPEPNQQSVSDCKASYQRKWADRRHRAPMTIGGNFPALNLPAAIVRRSEREVDGFGNRPREGAPDISPSRDRVPVAVHISIAPCLRDI